MATPNSDGSELTPTRWLPGVDGQAFTAACPHLGLTGDPDSRCTFVTEGHRCYRPARPRQIPPHVQSALCLSSGFERCPIYQGQQGDAPQRTRSRMPLWPVAAVALLLVLALTLVLALRWRSSDDVAPGTELVTANVDAAPTASLSPTEVAQTLTSIAILTQTPEPSPTTAPTPSPTPAPTATLPPTASASPAPSTHVVGAGESISAIAARYGLDPVALSQLNGIPWNATIYPGETLRLR